MIWVFCIAGLMLNNLGIAWWKMLFEEEKEFYTKKGVKYEQSTYDIFIAALPVVNFLYILIMLTIAHIFVKDEPNDSAN